MALGHVFGMSIPGEFADGPDAEDCAIWPQDDSRLNDMANEAHDNALNLDLNEPVSEEANMEIEDIKEEPVPQPNVPDQRQEPPLHISLSLSNVSPAMSFSSVVVNQDINVPEEAEPANMIVMALPALQAHHDQLPDLNEDLGVQDQNQGDPMQPLREQVIPDLNEAILGQRNADNVPMMPDVNLD